MGIMYSPEVLGRLRGQARAAKERMQGAGGDFARYAGFSGQGAIVQPGGTVEIRALPRWDFFAKRYAQKGGKIAENPAYVREPCWFGCHEHWFSGKDGKRGRFWCRKNLGADEPCPMCAASKALLAGSEEDAAEGNDVRQSEVYLYNVVLRAEPFGEDGKPAVYILRAPATVYAKISDLCTGAESEKFALGDVSDPWEGYDLAVTRPTKGLGGRYEVKAAREPSRLFPKGEEAKWGKWYLPRPGGLLYDLEKDVLDGVPTAAKMEEAYLGVTDGGSDSPDAGGAGDAPFAAPPGAQDDSPGGTSSENDDSPFGADIGMPEEPPAPPAQAVRRAATRSGRR